MVVLYLLLSVVLIILLTARLKIHPFIALFLVAVFYGLFAGMPLNEIVNSINQGFGDTLGKIGLLIVLGVIIGSFLENSGGAYSMAEKVLKIIGKKRVPTAMARDVVKMENARPAGSERRRRKIHNPTARNTKLNAWGI